MGGGDLNLKKSWHPHTMKNQERVWKAEQKDSEEKKRIAELQREINAERDKEDMQKFAEDSGVLKRKDDVKLEWMYKGPSQSVNHEDYLLGKAIDKNFERYNNEQRGGPSQDEESLPDAVRQAKSSMFSEQVDVQRKMNEDPLMAIRQRAVEKAKELYNNPVRLKQIRKMVSKSEEKGYKKDKKKKKKSKKSSKKDDEKDLDALLTAKLKGALKDRDLLRKLKKKARKYNSDSSSSSSSSSESDENEDEQSKSKSGKQHSATSTKETGQNRSHSPSNQRQRHTKLHSEEDKRHSRSPRSYSRRDYHEHSRRRSRSRSIDRERQSWKKDNPSKYVGKSADGRRRNEGQEASSSRRREDLPERKRNFRDRSSSASDTEQRKRANEESRYKRKETHVEKYKSSRDQSYSESDDEQEKKNDKKAHTRSDDSDDSDNGHRSKKKLTFGLMMADGSKPVVRQKPIQQEVKSVPAQQQKPVPWQKKERVKLTEEEKEKRRQEMLSNAAWRDKEREQNVKRYRLEEAQEKKQLHENFDDDFARKQFSRATDQTSVEGRIKSKLNTIQRSKMAMDQNFARR